MVDRKKGTREVVIDACCLVNFCAVDNDSVWLSQFHVSWKVPAAVHREGLYVRANSESTDLLRIDLEPAIVAGAIEICTPDAGAEMELYVELASVLDDGEALSLAIAKHRGWVLATDDRKARKRAADLSVRVLTTPQLMRRWCERTGQTARATADALRKIEQLARFTPAADSPDARWWVTLMKG